MITFLNCLLALIGYEIVYVAVWTTVDEVGSYNVEKTYMTRYSALDAKMGRPIHIDMGVAPPWAKMRVRRFNFMD